jgi:hypothetical protein
VDNNNKKQFAMDVARSAINCKYKRVHFDPALEAEDEERSRRRQIREEEKKVRGQLRLLAMDCQRTNRTQVLRRRCWVVVLALLLTAQTVKSRFYMSDSGNTILQNTYMFIFRCTLGLAVQRVNASSFLLTHFHFLFPVCCTQRLLKIDEESEFLSSIPPRAGLFSFRSSAD